MYMCSAVRSYILLHMHIAPGEQVEPAAACGNIVMDSVSIVTKLL